MNRRKRKQKEKELGIANHRKNLSRQQKFELMRRNIIEGKKRQKEMEELRRLQEQQNTDKQASREVTQKATKIVEEENIPYIDALKKAQSNS